MATSEAERLLRIARRDLRMARRLLDHDVEEASWGWACVRQIIGVVKSRGAAGRIRRLLIH